MEDISIGGGSIRCGCTGGGSIGGFGGAVGTASEEAMSEEALVVLEEVAFEVAPHR
jgi:hypothetical protein